MLQLDSSHSCYEQLLFRLWSSWLLLGPLRRTFKTSASSRNPESYLIRLLQGDPAYHNPILKKCRVEPLSGFHRLVPPVAVAVSEYRNSHWCFAKRPCEWNPGGKHQESVLKGLEDVTIHLENRCGLLPWTSNRQPVQDIREKCSSNCSIPQPVLRIVIMGLVC